MTNGDYIRSLTNAYSKEQLIAALLICGAKSFFEHAKVPREEAMDAFLTDAELLLRAMPNEITEIVYG